jgi:hypothetical protein
MIPHHPDEEEGGPVLVGPDARKDVDRVDHVGTDRTVHDTRRHDRSAPRDRGDERDLVTRTEWLVEQGVRLVHRDCRFLRKGVEGRTTPSELIDEVAHSCPLGQFDLERRRTYEVAIRGEEERVDGQSHGAAG